VDGVDLLDNRKRYGRLVSPIVTSFYQLFWFYTQLVLSTRRRSHKLTWINWNEFI